MTKTVILGDEYDDALRERLLITLRALGAEMIDGSWAVAGSQELESCRVRLDGEELVVEAETYVGLSLTGPAELADRVAAAIVAAY